MRLATCLLLALVPALLGQAPQTQMVPHQTHENLHSILWTQTALEHDALCLTAYRLAEVRLREALRDKRWTAALEQTGSVKGLPPAVILDIDETVLDNSPAQARFLLKNSEFTPEGWQAWVREGAARALPGAVEFTQFAASRGVTVFYVSNREGTDEEATRRNLSQAGFPVSGKEDTVLLRGEKPDWGGEKSTRRRFVAERYRVLLLVGDDLGDFVADIRTSLERRRELTLAHEGRWGRQWIMLPNPMYGSWEGAVLVSRPAEEGSGLKRKYGALRTR